jgi:GNAT acetyltransferase-like protein
MPAVHVLDLQRNQRAVDTPAREPLGSLFGRTWWLDAVSPGAWGAATVERGGRVVAELPWAKRRLAVPGLELVRVGSPPLTPFFAPELELGEGKPVTRLAREHELLDELIEKLPPFDYLSYTLAPGFSNWLPFHSHGFQGRLRATYVIDDISDSDQVWRGMTDHRRAAIRKAQRSLELVEDESAARLAAAVAATFERQRRRSPFDLRLLQRLHEAVVANDAGTILTAVDAAGHAHASALFVWEPSRAYYLTGGSHDTGRGNAAQSLVLWHAIRRAAEHAQTFDFEGSMIPGVARFFRGFGSRPDPYVQVTAVSRRLRIGFACRDLLRAVTGGGAEPTSRLG